MIKLVSFFAFLVAFIWTWFLFNSRSSVGVDVHAGIQSKLAMMIEDTIKKNRPSSTNFHLLKIYTEKLDDNKLNAKFSFQYDDKLEGNEVTSQVMNGDATLSRGLSEDPEIQKWIVQSVHTDSSSLEFKEGLVISSDGKSETPAPVEEKKTE